MNGSFIAAGLSYFISILLLSLLNLPAFSQQNQYAQLNLIPNTQPKHSTYSKRKTPHFYAKQNDSSIETIPNLSSTSPPPPNVFADCGTGAQGGEVTNPNGNNNVSPDSKVNNPSFAVDGNLSTYSELHIAVQQKDVEVVQKITFGGAVYANDMVKLTLSLGAALQNYEVSAQAYNGNTPVGIKQDLYSSLLLHPNTTDYIFKPGVVFDQVRISVVALQNGNHVASINLHEIYVTPPPPKPQDGTTATSTSSNVSQCQGTVALKVDNPDSNMEYKWYNSSSTYLTTATTYSPPNLLPGSYTYYVGTVRAGCTLESARHQINLTVSPKPIKPLIISSN